MNYQIYTMYVNRKDLLQNALASLGSYQNQAVIIDNSPNQDLSLPGFPGEILRPPVPLSCSQSYNLILNLALERQQDAFFIMHSDAQASEEIVARLLSIADDLNQQRRRWGVLLTNYDVLCLSNTSLVKDIRWDPYLPLYYTDVDYYRRLQLAGIEIIETGLPVQHLEGGSTTAKADPALQTYIKTNYPAWRQYYIEKWGGERGEETFSTPFNASSDASVTVTLYPRQHG